MSTPPAHSHSFSPAVHQSLANNKRSSIGSQLSQLPLPTTIVNAPPHSHSHHTHQHSHSHSHTHNHLLHQPNAISPPTRSPGNTPPALPHASRSLQIQSTSSDREREFASPNSPTSATAFNFAPASALLPTIASASAAPPATNTLAGGGGGAPPLSLTANNIQLHNYQYAAQPFNPSGHAGYTTSLAAGGGAGSFGYAARSNSTHAGGIQPSASFFRPVRPGYEDNQGLGGQLYQAPYLLADASNSSLGVDVERERVPDAHPHPIEEGMEAETDVETDLIPPATHYPLPIPVHAPTLNHLNELNHSSDHIQTHLDHLDPPHDPHDAGGGGGGAGDQGLVSLKRIKLSKEPLLPTSSSGLGRGISVGTRGLVSGNSGNNPHKNIGHTDGVPPSGTGGGTVAGRLMRTSLDKVFNLTHGLGFDSMRRTSGSQDGPYPNHPNKKRGAGDSVDVERAVHAHRPAGMSVSVSAVAEGDGGDREEGEHGEGGQGVFGIPMTPTTPRSQRVYAGYGAGYKRASITRPRSGGTDGSASDHHHHHHGVGVGGKKAGGLGDKRHSLIHRENHGQKRHSGLLSIRSRSPSSHSPSPASFIASRAHHTPSLSQSHSHTHPNSHSHSFAHRSRPRRTHASLSHQPLLSPRTHRPLKRYHLHPSRNRFFVGGRLLTGGDTPYAFMGSLMVVCGIAAFWFAGVGRGWWGGFADLREGANNEGGDGGVERRLSKVGKALVIVVVYGAGVVLSSMFATAFTDPGILPRELDPDPPYPTTSPSDGGIRVPMPRDLKVRSDVVRVKYCPTCRTYRPPRSSHCKMCDNCVDGCDHHCQWVNNCVGRRNYTSFFVLLMSATITLLLIITTSALYLFFETKYNPRLGFKGALKTTTGALSAVSFCLSVAVIWPVGALLSYHMRLLLLNVTTIEQIRNQAHKTLVPGPAPPNPFSHGSWRRNLVAVLCKPQGQSWLNASAIATEDKRQVNPGTLMDNVALKNGVSSHVRALGEGRRDIIREKKRNEAEGWEGSLGIARGSGEDDDDEDDD